MATLKWVPRSLISDHILLRLVTPYITPYHTLCPRLETKPFSFGNFKISFQGPNFLSHLITCCHPFSHLCTLYPIGWKQNHFHLATLKLVVRIMFLSPFAIGIKNGFPNRIMRMTFYQKYYQLLLSRKFPRKEKKLLVVGPPDSGKTSWFYPFQGIQVNTDLLLSSKKVTVIICSWILFTKNFYHIEASQFICIANHLSGF